MPDLGLSPTRPGQPVIVATDLRIVLRRPEADQVEFRLVLHMCLEALRRLTAITGRPASAIDLAQQIGRIRPVVLDLDVLEHLVGKAELLGEEIHDLVVVLRLEGWFDDLLAPLQ